MTTEELYDKLKLIQKMKCKTQNLELKSAEQGCPKRLYDSLSSLIQLLLIIAPLHDPQSGIIRLIIHAVIVKWYEHSFVDRFF